jgi:hypothetical protein
LYAAPVDFPARVEAERGDQVGEAAARVGVGPAGREEAAVLPGEARREPI